MIHVEGFKTLTSRFRCETYLNFYVSVMKHVSFPWIITYREKTTSVDSGFIVKLSYLLVNGFGPF